MPNDNGERRSGPDEITLLLTALLSAYAFFSALFGSVHGGLDVDTLPFSVGLLVLLGVNARIWFHSFGATPSLSTLGMLMVAPPILLHSVCAVYIVGKWIVGRLST